MLLTTIFTNRELQSAGKWFLAAKDAQGLYRLSGLKEVENRERLMSQNNKIV